MDTDAMRNAAERLSAVSKNAARKSTEATKTAAQKGGAGAKTAAHKTAAVTAAGVEVVSDTITQAAAFEAFNAALEEMTMVISVQHARLGDLEERVMGLEQRLRL